MTKSGFRDTLRKLVRIYHDSSESLPGRTIHSLERRLLKTISVPSTLLSLYLGSNRSLREVWNLARPGHPVDRIDALVEPRVDFSYPYVNRAARVDHTSRYVFAAQELADIVDESLPDTHLDIASGLGYGGELLRAVLGDVDVLGVEIDSDAITYANNHYPAGLYLRGSATSVPVKTDSIGTITCLETLEHVPGDVELLEELDRVLAPQGAAIISVPYQEKLDVAKKRKEFLKEYPHVNTYDGGVLREKLDRTFSDRRIILFGQHQGVTTQRQIEKKSIPALQPVGIRRFSIDSNPSVLLAFITPTVPR